MKTAGKWILLAGLLAAGCPSNRTPAHQANPIPPGVSDAAVAKPTAAGGSAAAGSADAGGQ